VRTERAARPCAAVDLQRYLVSGGSLVAGAGGAGAAGGAAGGAGRGDVGAGDASLSAEAEEDVAAARRRAAAVWPAMYDHARQSTRFEPSFLESYHIWHPKTWRAI